jgi:pSer/pThr/pTyr-binding forkhead associated (FHA) protein
METRALIELLDRHDEVIGRYRTEARELTIGRSLDCDIVLDDPYTSEHHASLSATDKGWKLRLETSINGAWVDNKLLAGNTQHELPPGVELELGQTRLRLRHPLQALPPEQALPNDHRQSQSWTRYLPSPKAMLLLGLVCGWNLGASWLESQPDSPWSNYFDDVISTIGFAALWGGIWSLITQLFRREMPFWYHLQAGLMAYLFVRFSVLAMSLGAYALSTPILSHITGWISVLGLMTACWFCARRIWPRRQRRMTFALAVLTLLWIAPQTIKLHANQYRWLQPLYLSTLAPPTMRLTEPVPTSDFVQDVRTLQSSLIAAASKDQDKSEDLQDNDEE